MSITITCHTRTTPGGSHMGYIRLKYGDTYSRAEESTILRATPTDAMADAVRLHKDFTMSPCTSLVWVRDAAEAYLRGDQQVEALKHAMIHAEALGQTRLAIVETLALARQRVAPAYLDTDGMAVNLREYVDEACNPFDHQSSPNGCPATCPACGWDALQEERDADRL